MRFAAIALICLSLLGCTTEIEPDVSATAIGDFSLVQVAVDADRGMRGALSRKASPAQLESALDRAMASRFARFDGAGRYGLKLTVAGYVLAAPGIPVLVAPKSVLGIEAQLFVLENGAFRELTEKPQRFVVFEDAGGDTVVGSGFTQSAEEQLSELSDNAAIEIEKWLRNNPQWFQTAAKAPAR